MASPLPPQSKGDSTPDPFEVPGGGGASGDRLYDIAVKVSGIERSATMLEGFASDAKGQLRDIEKQLAAIPPVLAHMQKCLDKVETKMDEVKLDVHGAKKIAWVFGILVSAIGAIGLVFLNKILDVVVAHYAK